MAGNLQSCVPPVKRPPAVMPGKLPGGLFEIRRADDVLAVEHGPRPMAGDLHRDALRDVAVHETPDNGPAEVMAESLPALVGEPEHSPHHRELAVDHARETRQLKSAKLRRTQRAAWSDVVLESAEMSNVRLLGKCRIGSTHESLSLNRCPTNCVTPAGRGSQLWSI